MDTKSHIREFIQANLIVFDDDAVFADDDNIFEKGFVNSLFAMRLLTHVEEQFSITVSDEEMEISNFSTVNRICSLIESKSLVSS